MPALGSSFFAFSRFAREGHFVMAIIIMLPKLPKGIARSPCSGLSVSVQALQTDTSTKHAHCWNAFRGLHPSQEMMLLHFLSD